MTTPRKPTPPTTTAIDDFCAQFDDLFCRRAERAALRSYLIGLLLPREHNKTLSVLASLVPGTDRQRLHHFLHDAPSRRGRTQPAAPHTLAGRPADGAACGRGVDHR